jgi:hypothetical protein
MPRAFSLRPALALAAFLACLPLAGAARAGSFSDDFEGYPLDTFPAAGWLDVRSLALPNAPLPSARVVATTDASGSPTKALQTVAALSASRGVFRPIATATEHRLEGDVRVDRFAGPGAGATAVGSWPLLFGVAELLVGSDICCFPTAQVGLYVDTRSKGFRLFSNDGAGHATDIDLGAGAQVDAWYHVALDLEVASGTVLSRVVDRGSQQVIVDQTDEIPGWTPAAFDAITFFGGELDAFDAAGIGTLDAVAYTAVPEPSVLALLGLCAFGLGVTGRRARRGSERRFHDRTGYAPHRGVFPSSGAGIVVC